MKTPSDIIETLGREAVAARVGVGVDAVRMALVAGKLPAAWFHALEQMAGCDLPRDCFTFKGIAAE